MVVIDRIEIESYGGLKERVLELRPGLNVISAPNEWGKTTTVSFVKFVFYGLPKSRKKLELADYERRRMTPWDGAPMAGAVEFTKDGERLRLYRQLTERREVVKLTRAATGAEVDLRGAVPGEAVFGLDLGSFERTILTLQSGVAVREHEALEARLRNLVTSGEEDVSFERARQALETAQRRYRHKKGSAGGLMQLEAELENCEREYERSVAGYDRYLAAAETAARSEAALAAAEAETGRLMAETGRSEAAEAAAKLRRIEALEKERAELAARAAELRAPAEEELTALRAELAAVQSERENLLRRRARVEEVRAERARVEKLLREAEGEPGAGSARYEEAEEVCARAGGVALALCGALLLVLGAAAAVVLFMLGVAAWGILGVAVAAAGCALLGVWLSRRGARRRALARCGARDEAALRAALRAGREASERVQQRAAELERVTLVLSELEREQAALTEAATGRVEALLARCGVAELAEVERVISDGAAARRAAEAYAQQIKLCEARLVDAGASERAALMERAAGYDGAAPLSGEELRQRLETARAAAAEERAALENARAEMARYRAETRTPGEISADRERLSRTLDRARIEDAALTLAAELLDAAHTRVEERFAPELCRRASAYFEEITGGKYGRMQIDHRYQIAIFDAGDYRELGYFSAGTRDAAYLALRLAVTELLFPGELPPAFFDDSFTRLDGERLRRLLALYGRSGRQLVVLSCGGRERELLEETR